LRTHFTDVSAVRLWLEAVTYRIAIERGSRRVKTETGPAFPGLLSLAAFVAMRLPLTASQREKGSQSMRRETFVRYHYGGITHAQIWRQISPVVNHLRDNHRNRDHSANNQNHIMRRLH
jgi:hypothetical protein